jgi:phosphatidylglycerophosphatase A
VRPPEQRRARPLAAIACSTALGVGYVPIAPGTFGSLAGLVVWYALPASAWVHAIAIALIFAAGVWSATAAGRYFGSGDPGPVVIDEVMGMLLTMFLNPGDWGTAVLGLLLFRAFDIIKPYPANRLERLHGGLGVMADDAMAAVYANLALRVYSGLSAYWA